MESVQSVQTQIKPVQTNAYPLLVLLVGMDTHPDSVWIFVANFLLTRLFFPFLSEILLILDCQRRSIYQKHFLSKALIVSKGRLVERFGLEKLSFDRVCEYLQTVVLQEHPRFFFAATYTD